MQKVELTRFVVTCGNKLTIIEAESSGNYSIKAFIDEESGNREIILRKQTKYRGEVPLGTSSVVTSEFIPVDSGLQKYRVPVGTANLFRLSTYIRFPSLNSAAKNHVSIVPDGTSH